MQIINHYLVPEYVFLGNKIVPTKKLRQEDQIEVRRRCQHESVLQTKPNLRKVLEKSFTVMKFGGSYTSKEYLDLVRFFESKNLVVQWNIKRAHGGGRGATSWGKIDVAKTNIIEEILKDYGVWEEFCKLNLNKRMNRVAKIVGDMVPVKVKPRILLIDDAEYEGIIWARPSWMKQNGLVPGSKTALFMKSLIFPMTSSQEIRYQGYDLVIGQDENKFKLSAEKLAEHFHVNPLLTPSRLFSKKLKARISDKIGRLPTAKYDLMSFINMVPEESALDEIRRIYSGDVTPDDIKVMFGYKDRDGNIRYRTEGRRLLAGESIHHPDIWPSALKVLKNMAHHALWSKVHGIYGVAMPLSLLKRYRRNNHTFTAYVTRWPWILPIKAQVAVWADMIAVPDGLWKAFGGDYDGDQACALQDNRVDTNLTWWKDKAWLKAHMRLPEKQEDDSLNNMSEYEIIARQLDQYQGCGITYNNGKIVVEAARLAGITGRDLQKLDILITSQDVQPFIDGQKYKGGDKPPSIQELADKYKVPQKYLARAQMFFRTLRSRNTSLQSMIDAAEIADPESSGFYQRVVSLFRNFPKPEYKQEENPEIDKRVKEVFRQYKNSAETRAEILAREFSVMEAARYAFRNRDWNAGNILVDKILRHE